MLRHHLLIMYRNFVRTKSYFAINVFGLTAGLTCTLLIYLWVDDELHMDKFHQQDARIYRVMEHQQYADEVMTTTSTPGILAETLKEELAEIELAATTTWVNSFTLSVGDKNVKADGYDVGPDYFRIFSYPFVSGSPETALQDKTGIVISRELAVKLFRSAEEAMGKTLEVQHEKSYQVTGVFEKMKSSAVQFDFALSFEAFKDSNPWVLSWGNNGPGTIILLRNGANAQAVSEKIKDFVGKREEQSNVTLFLKKFSDHYLYGRYLNGQPSGGRIEYVRLFAVIAVFILMIACINFMNLSTARASRRAKEVGIKKSVGAQRYTLVSQYLSESFVTTLIALLLAVGFVWMILPQFNAITGKQIELNLLDARLITGMVVLTLVTGLLAGSYPAFFLSGFKPATVLKGEVRGSWSELLARKGLVIFQFFLAVILIVAVLVIYEQIRFVQAKNLGYKKENLIRIPMEGKVRTSTEAFLHEVKQVPGVISASTIGHSLLGRNNNTSGLTWEGKHPDDEILFENIRVNYELLEALGVELAEGRSFSREHSADTNKIIFNEAGIRAMNLTDPIGKKIRLWDEQDLEIIGVVKDFHFQSLHDVVNPLFFLLSPRNTWNVMIRLEVTREQQALEELKQLYTRFNPGFTFDYVFQDEEYARMYRAEQRVASLAGYFSVFAILISCLGLFGLAAFTAERRWKEIGIRKALGSSSVGIVLLLSKEYARLVLLAILLGLPVSYWLLNEWLEKFAFRVPLSMWYFVFAGFIAMCIAWATVASQAIRAARVNPAECLKID